MKKQKKADAGDPVTHPASQEAVDDDAEGPPVNAVAVLLPTQDFRGCHRDMMASALLCKYVTKKYM